MATHHPTSDDLFAVGRYRQAHRFFYKFALFCALSGMYSLMSTPLYTGVPRFIGWGIGAGFCGIALGACIIHDLRLVRIALVCCGITSITHSVTFIHAVTHGGLLSVGALALSPFTALVALVPMRVLHTSVAFHRAALSTKPNRVAERWIHDRANKARTLGPRYTANSVHFHTTVDSKLVKYWKGWLEQDVIVLTSGSAVWVLSPTELSFQNPQGLSLMGPKVIVQGRYYHGYHMDEYSLKNYTAWQAALSVHDDVWVPHA